MQERTLGRFLRDDDELVLRQAAAAELRWRREDPQVRSPMRILLADQDDVAMMTIHRLRRMHEAVTGRSIQSRALIACDDSLGSGLQGAARVDEQAARLRDRSGARGPQAAATPPATDGAAPAPGRPAAYNQPAGARPPARSPAAGAVRPARPPPPPDAGGGTAPAARRTGAWWARDANAGGITDADLLAAAAAGVPSLLGAQRLLCCRWPWRLPSWHRQHTHMHKPHHVGYAHVQIESCMLTQLWLSPHLIV